MILDCMMAMAISGLKITLILGINIIVHLYHIHKTILLLILIIKTSS